MKVVANAEFVLFLVRQYWLSLTNTESSKHYVPWPPELRIRSKFSQKYGQPKLTPV